MDTKELLKKVRKIEIKSRRLSDNLFGGEYLSTFKGRGMTFSEVRKYEFGDDIRSIDWNVTARYNEPFIKIFEEERELTVMLLVDVSGSEAFATKNKLKKEIITEIAATLAFSALKNNDKVGAILFSDKVELFIPPNKGKTRILRIIRELIEFTPNSIKTNIDSSLRFLLNVIQKKAIVFLLSDFIDDNYEKSLKLASKKFDLTGIRIYDIKETEIPKIGIVPIIDAESGKLEWVDTNSKKVRHNYKTNYDRNIKQFHSLFKKNGAGIIDCRVDESYVKKLLGYFKLRA
ncbi:MAG TPA: DUF58 domain-containing protein [Flavobacteriaceae bacterium]|jgi:uncharacterized protein (DUF58 family)|nr:DUF58 domain-containing protein [Flavobacteriaceae bacterium]HJO70826.1 DUF58 domain-containing protein [Flavobacteriaceae bacterium]|tara:strand:+ start:541 stop:1407 length:867 start_codon:yes stop_codon:yes gene_type:complete